MTRTERNNIHWLCQQRLFLALVLEEDQRECAARTLQLEAETSESASDSDTSECDTAAGADATPHTETPLNADSIDITARTLNRVTVQQPATALQRGRVDWENVITLGSEHITEEAVLLHIPVGTLSIVLFASFKAAKALFHTISSTLVSADVIGTTKLIRDLHKLVKQQQSDDTLTGPKGHNRRHGA
eukprot:2310190-Rhodomonas_salina.1